MLNPSSDKHAERSPYTNGEKRAAIYSGRGRPTDPVTVNRKTALADLNLNWREKELPERERTKHVHRLHPYLGTYIPQLVEVFLRKFFKKGDTVLDPFCGSGTTLVQANELGNQRNRLRCERVQRDARENQNGAALRKLSVKRSTTSRSSSTMRMFLDAACIATI